MNQTTDGAYNSDERQELEATVGRNCACTFEPSTGDLISQCAPHGMLDSDTRALNGLLFMRRKRARLFVGEFSKE